MTNYVTIFEEYKHKFFQLPKVFFTSDKYKDMSNNAKIAWAILKDRSSLSRKNEWFDKDTGRIYFIYKNKELMEILNIKSETTLSNLKKELESAGLIEQERMGFNRPNKLYLIYPVVEEEDIYKIDEFENYEYKKENRSQSQSEQGTSKNGAPNNEVPYPQKMESSNTDSSNTDLKDLDTNDTTMHEQIFDGLASDKKKRKQEYMQKGFLVNEDVVPRRIAIMLDAFSEDEKQASEYYRKIILAKKKVEDEFLVAIRLENEPELEGLVINAFSRAILKIEKERNIQNPDAYIYQTIYQTIHQEISARARRRETSDVYFDWTSEQGVL